MLEMAKKYLECLLSDENRPSSSICRIALQEMLRRKMLEMAKKCFECLLFTEKRSERELEEKGEGKKD